MSPEAMERAYQEEAADDAALERAQERSSWRRRESEIDRADARKCEHSHDAAGTFMACHSCEGRS